MKTRPFEVIVFDLGGVLIELSGVPRMLEWMKGKVTVEELWHRWLSSPGVRQFETGRSTPTEFAVAVLQEFQLPVDVSQFLEEFTQWPTRVYPGAVPLLQSLSAHYTLASLANTNVLHWQRICTNMDLTHLFDIHFPSHEIGLLKPDRTVFEHVVQVLHCQPEQMLFLDDNQVNIDSARAHGLVAYKVSGIAETRGILTALGVLEQA